MVQKAAVLVLFPVQHQHGDIGQQTRWERASLGRAAERALHVHGRGCIELARLGTVVFSVLNERLRHPCIARDPHLPCR